MTDQSEAPETNQEAAITAKQRIDRHEKALLQGDLSDLSNQERKSFYAEVCDSLGLNPMTQPLEYIWLSGDLTLYANKTAANQLRELHGVSITDLDINQSEGLHTVYAYAKDEAGRRDVDAGIVDVSNQRGEALANARMKAITKAKRRVTLSICGLGFLDKTEVDDIPDNATKDVSVNYETGEIEANNNGQRKQQQEYRNGVSIPADQAAMYDKWNARLSELEGEELHDAIDTAEETMAAWGEEKQLLKRALTDLLDEHQMRLDEDSQTQEDEPTNGSSQDTDEPDSETQLPEDMPNRNFLISAGVDTVEKLHTAVQSDEHNLEDLDGIGEKTAESARDWLQNRSE